MKIASISGLLLTVLLWALAGAEVIKTGTCTGSGATSKLTLSPSNGKLEIEFEVHSKTNGEVWKVVINRRTKTIYNQNKKTSTSEHSFDAKLVNGPGIRGQVKAVATNQSTGQKCSATATLK